jgi:hypothetical protein
VQCFSGGVFQVVFFRWCFSGGVFQVVFFRWCFSGGVFQVVFFRFYSQDLRAVFVARAFFPLCFAASPV